MKPPITNQRRCFGGWGMLLCLSLWVSGAGAQGFLQGVVGLLGGDRQYLSELVLGELGLADGLALSAAQMQVLNGIVGAGVFESLVDGDPKALGAETLADLALVAVQANRALEAGIAPEAVEEIAQAALAAPLESDVFIAAARAQDAMDGVGVNAGVSRSWLGYALIEDWSAPLLAAAGLGVAEVVRLGGDAEQMALALSVAIARDPDRDPADIVRQEREFLLGEVEGDEALRRQAIFTAYRAGVDAGVPRSVAYGIYEHALLEEWPAGRSSQVLEGIGRGVAAGLPAQALALALVVRFEQDSGNGVVADLVAEEMAFVRQSLALPEPEIREATPALADTVGATVVPSQETDTVAPAPKPPSAESSDPVALKPDPAPVPVAIEEAQAIPEAVPKPPVPLKTRPKEEVGSGTGAVAKKVAWNSLERSIKSFLGTPYVWGGETRRGTDCSGFTQTVYQEQGVKIPRVSRDQYGFLKRSAVLVGGASGRKGLGRGALVFFNKNGRGRITHVGVYMGAGKFAHASSSRGVVISDFNKRYYQRLFVDGGPVCRVN